MSGIDGTNQPLSCRSRSFKEACGSIYTENRAFICMYGSFTWYQSGNGGFSIHQCAVPQWFVTTSMMTFRPFPWAVSTIFRYRALSPKRGSMW